MSKIDCDRLEGKVERTVNHDAWCIPYAGIGLILISIYVHVYN